MARFEQRISDEEVSAARKKILAGASLRSAAAEIPCAPSTLSVRIKKAEAAEAGALGRSAIGENRQLAAQGASEDAARHAIAAGEAELPGQVDPIEVLRGAMQATKSDGQPDWPTRLSAVRALAALRPEELEPKEGPVTQPSIVVYDLPPGSAPVEHRAWEGVEAGGSDADLPSRQDPTSLSGHVFNYHPPHGESVPIGIWFPPDHGQPGVGSQFLVRRTDDREEADRWRAELSAGRLPEGSDDVPEAHDAPGATRS